MAVIKGIKNSEGQVEGRIIADKGAIDHSQLANRNAMGAHSIASIRKLPEKLFELKDANMNLSQKIGNLSLLDTDVKDNLVEAINELKNFDSMTGTETLETDSSTLIEAINEINTKAKDIELIIDDITKIATFINYSKEEIEFPIGKEPDNNTIELDDENKFTLKNKNDEETIITDNNENKIFAKALRTSLDDTPLDADTLKTFKNDTETKIGSENLTTQQSTLSSAINELNLKISDILYDIGELNNKVQSFFGDGGYLDPNDFGTLTPTQVTLNSYAKQKLSISEEEDIPKGLKIKNTYQSSNDIWIFNKWLDEDEVIQYNWINLGPATIAVATLTALGTVKSSLESGQISVDINGIMSVNGFENKVSKFDIQDNLNSESDDKPLSANQGKILKGFLDAKSDEAPENGKIYARKDSQWIEISDLPIPTIEDSGKSLIVSETGQYILQ